MCKKIVLACGRTVIIDNADHERVQKHGWAYSKNQHITATIGNKRIYLHHFIMGQKPPKGYRVIHINYDLLDFRRENLVWVLHWVACQRQPLKETPNRDIRVSYCIPKSANGWRPSPMDQREFTWGFLMMRWRLRWLMTKLPVSTMARMHDSVSLTKCTNEKAKDSVPPKR